MVEWPGYPLQLQEKRSPECRMLAIAEAYHAMTTFRPAGFYRKKLLLNCAARQAVSLTGVGGRIYCMLAARQTNFTAAEEDAVAFKELNQEQN